MPNLNIVTCPLLIFMKINEEYEESVEQILLGRVSLLWKSVFKIMACIWIRTLDTSIHKKCTTFATRQPFLLRIITQVWDIKWNDDIYKLVNKTKLQAHYFDHYLWLSCDVATTSWRFDLSAMRFFDFVL